MRKYAQKKLSKWMENANGKGTRNNKAESSIDANLRCSPNKYRFKFQFGEHTMM